MYMYMSARSVIKYIYTSQLITIATYWSPFQDTSLRLSLRGVILSPITVIPALKTSVYKTTWLLNSIFYGPQGYTFNIIEPAYKDRLSITTMFCWSPGLSFYTSFTVRV